MNDFVNLTNEERESYWNIVLKETDKLVSEFHMALEKDGGRSAVKPIESIL